MAVFNWSPAAGGDILRATPGAGPPPGAHQDPGLPGALPGCLVSNLHAELSAGAQCRPDMSQLYAAPAVGSMGMPPAGALPPIVGLRQVAIGCPTAAWCAGLPGLGSYCWSLEPTAPAPRVGSRNAGRLPAAPPRPGLVLGDPAAAAGIVGFQQRVAGYRCGCHNQLRISTMERAPPLHSQYRIECCTA